MPVMILQTFKEQGKGNLFVPHEVKHTCHEATYREFFIMQVGKQYQSCLFSTTPLEPGDGFRTILLLSVLLAYHVKDKQCRLRRIRSA